MKTAFHLCESFSYDFSVLIIHSIEWLAVESNIFAVVCSNESKGQRDMACKMYVRDSVRKRHVELIRDLFKVERTRVVVENCFEIYYGDIRDVFISKPDFSIFWNISLRAFPYHFFFVEMAQLNREVEWVTFLFLPRYRATNFHLSTFSSHAHIVSITRYHSHLI